MHFDHINTYLKGFQKDDAMPFPCPFCERTSLSLKADSWYVYDQGQYAKKSEYSTPDEVVSYAYNAVYLCGNNQCEQEIFSSGIGKVYLAHIGTDDENYYETHEEYFQPRFFQPPVHFFTLANDIPYNIRASIELSFSLVLQSPVAAVNGLRSAVEELLDAHGIQKNHQRTLHTRIETDVPNNTVLAPFKDLLMAIKWLGNSGSHGDVVELDLILYVYEVLELILNSLYGINRTPYLNAVAQATNLARRALTPQELSNIPQN